MVRLRILGSAELRKEDGTLLWVVTDQPKLLGLTAYLTLTSSAGATRRDTLLPLFWPESETGAARHALSQALSVIRSGLGPEILNSKYRNAVKFNSDNLWCDALAFRSALAEDRPAAALEHYGGSLLDGFYVRQAGEFERWLDGERRQLRRQAVGAALDLATAAHRDGRWEEGREWAERAVALELYEEKAWRALISCLNDSGNRAGALLAYERMAESFQADLGIEPSGETLGLVESIRSGEAPAASSRATEMPRLAEERQPDPGSQPDEVTEPGEAAGPEPIQSDGVENRWLSTKARVVLVAVALAAAAWVGTIELAPTRDGIDPDSVRSLVVSPLVDPSASVEDEYFADALTAEIGRELGRIQGLDVTSHGSAQLSTAAASNAGEVARLLDVDAVLEGRVSRGESHVSVVLRLLDRTGERQLWSGTYQSGLGDLLGLRRRIATDVGRAIRASETSVTGVQEVPSLHPRAYDAYLRGLHHLERYSTQEAEIALRYLEHSVELEPEFASAQAALARACVWAWGDGTPIDAAPCEVAAREAIRLDTALAEGHAALGFVLLRRLLFGLDAQWDWAAAERSFREAIRLNPNSAFAFEDYSELLRIQRRVSESRVAIDRARQLNPLSPGVKLRIGIQQLVERRFEAALVAWNEILATDPTYATAHYAMGATYIGMEEPAKVLAEADSVANRLGEDHLWVADLRAHGYALAGDRESALRFAQRPSPARPDRLILSGVHLLLGDTAAALTEVERALQEQLPELPNVTSSSRYDGLRDHPRFVAVREAIGLN
ncbi:MAG: BTAD domain-containing putative transcriptional regulator [Gemmatimonadota bacterium]